jgi:hypothetical protein
MVAVLIWLTGALAAWAEAPAATRALRLSALIVAGALVYTLATLAGGLRPRHLEKGGA